MRPRLALGSAHEDRPADAQTPVTGSWGAAVVFLSSFQASYFSNPLFSEGFERQKWKDGDERKEERLPGEIHIL